MKQDQIQILLLIGLLLDAKQWGSYVLAAGGSGVVSYPITFKQEGYHVFLQHSTSSLTDVKTLTLIDPGTVTSFRVKEQNNLQAGVNFIAIGK